MNHDSYMKDQIIGLFPNTAIEVIEQAVSDSISIEEAVDFILRKTEQKDCKFFRNFILY